jgi:quercetin dioxygenase-like cupin family protein
MSVIVRRFEQPDERHLLGKGTLEVLRVGSVALGRARYEPGWRWSTHVGAASGQRSCPVEHVCMVLSGRSGLRMDDGTEYEFGPGDVFYVPPGHDSWVVGEEPYVSLHLLGTEAYAATKREA